VLSRRLAGLLLGLAALVAGTTLAAAPATAALCGHWVANAEGEMTYQTFECGTEDTAGPGGGGGGSTVTCYRGRQASFNYDVSFCSGELSCYRFIPPPTAEDPAAWPERPAGVDPTASYANQACFTQPPEEALVSNEYIWVTPSEQDIAAQVDVAFGALVAPAFSLGFNPPTRAVVNLPTWFWAAGAGGGAVTGSSAGGLVAVATPDHLEVDPGDGSGSFRCAWAVTASDTCAYTYPRSSAGEPAVADLGPAYQAQMRLVYTVRFELNGAPFEVAGLPTEFTSTWQTTPVPVAEIQSLVGSRGA
jgi:hypothetical protein